MVTLNYETQLFPHLFAVYGVDATIVVGATSASITAIDRTKGIAVGDKPEVETIYPVARVLMGDLETAGILLDDIDGGSISLNSQTWRIDFHKVNANSRGELNGTVDLILVDEGSSS